MGQKLLKISRLHVILVAVEDVLKPKRDIEMTAKKFKLYRLYIAIGVLYFILALPFLKNNYLDEYSQIRLTSLIPMAAGLLCGFPGALACALGNLAGDIYSGLDIYCIFGFIGNFFMAWFPYKLWHTLFLGKSSSLQYLGTPASIFKFVSISIITGCASAGTIAAGGHLLGGFSFGSFFLPVALQYYDYSLLGGMLICQLCLTVFHVKPHIPEKVYEYSCETKYYIVDYILAGVIVLASCILALLTHNKEISANPVITALCFVVLLFSVILGCLPMKRGSRKNTRRGDYSLEVGIGAQFITVFLLILSMILVSMAVVSIRILYVDFFAYPGGLSNVASLWIRVIITVAVAGTFFIIALPLLLYWIQRIVVRPVREAANYTRQFVTGGELNEEQLHFNRTGNELDQLGESINSMADNIRSFVDDIRLRTAKEEKMAAQLNIASSIQQGLLPGKWSGTGFDIAPFIKPAREVGGDFYHFSQLDEDRTFVCIADVSGKDISAAMFMVQAKILIEENCALAPEQMMSRVNNTLSKSNQALMFVTVFAAVLDRKEKCMTYVNAGHNPPICLNHGKVFWLADEPDFVLGPMEGLEFKQHRLEMGEDFKLFIYTDGVNEAEGAGGEQFGNDRTFDTVKKALHLGGTCQDVLQSIEAAVFQFTEDSEQSDDITMLAVSVTE